MQGVTVADLFPSLGDSGFVPIFPKGDIWEILNPDNENNLKSQFLDMERGRLGFEERYWFDELEEWLLDSVMQRRKPRQVVDLSNGGYGLQDEYWYPLAHGEIHGQTQNCVISSSAKIGKDVCIEGPVYIGKNAEIRHGAYIRPYSWISEGAVVGHCTEVKHSILLPGAKAPHFNYVGDSILGTGVNLGAGCKLSNFRNDGRNILIRDGETGELLKDSGLRKFGAILGEGVQLGCNVVTNPGTIMGKESGAWPNVTVSGLIKSGQTVKE